MAKKELTFEEAMNRLEEIVDALEGGDYSLDESLKLFEEGVKLVKSCNKIIFVSIKNIRYSEALCHNII